MECLAISKLPDGSNWSYEIKLDGYRAEAVRSSNGVAFYSRNGKSLNKKFPYVVEALRDLPPDTVVDGELVALDDSGRPEFNLLQNYTGAAQSIRYFVFDVMVLKGRDLRGFPLSERRKLLGLLPFTSRRIVVSEVFDVSAETMIAEVPVSRTQVACRPSIVTGIVVRVAFSPLAIATEAAADARRASLAPAATAAAMQSAKTGGRNENLLITVGA